MNKPASLSGMVANRQIDLAGDDGSNARSLPIAKQYLRIVFRWRYVILGIVAASLLIGGIVTLMMTPLYTATTSLEISRDTNKVVKIEGVEQESNAADLEFYQTQYGLLKSHALAEQVASQLKLAESREFFAMFRTAIPGGDGGGSGALPIAGHEARLRKAADILLSNLSIDPVRMSRLVNVSFTSPDPAFSASVANAWSKNFIESNLARRFEATSYARKFLEGRLDQLRQKLEQSERELVGYASAQRIINLPSASAGGTTTPEHPIMADDLVALNGALADATADRMKAEARYRSASGGSAGSAPEELSNSTVAALRQKRADVAADYARITSQFEPGFPQAKALASQLDQIDRSIEREVGRVRSSLVLNYQESVGRENALKARVAALEEGLLNLKRRSIQYNIYQREVDTNRELYDGLLQRYKEIGVAGGVGTNNVSIVDAANVPTTRSRPHLMFNLLVALLAGVALGALAAIVLENSDEAISDPQDVQRELGYPLLGAIPKSPLSPVEALADRKSSLVEAYLSVQTNLEFSTDHGVPGTFAVTSTRPGEGKTTTATSLATALARAHKKVVLIDGDMRSPSLHSLLGASNAVGLSNYLSGHDVSEDFIQTHPTFGFALITAGPIPPNAAELLTGDRLPELLTSLRKRFDHVVIDSPPVVGLADAPLIASRVEGIIFAVESHGVRATLVRVALGRLQAANARIIGSVLTKFELARAHFGYGYDYGYGYGHAESGQSSN